ncbi:hypothetical protein LPY66_09810 [Dehalobacter sp. DCM]|uniref:3-oxoacyl-[acyl-carrier-protein] synthase III C-terminal domain-containing protein n=1 Tax=Dehalobacter sp. DCM TaxID=2907827 RepID=UPI003081E8DA|nr:hypothetical protein LPY66_09810 [Dehalobacter sp. DCM]
MKVGFETIVNYLPDEILDVKKHFEYLKPVVEKMSLSAQGKLKNVPDQVRRLRDVSAAEMMAIAVGKKALEKSALVASDIDAVIVTQTGGKQFMPLLGSFVHLNLGFRKDIIVRNIVDDNVSTLNAAYIAWNFVKSGLCRRVLIITVAAQIGGQYKFGVDLTDPLAQNYGDGAAAAIISAEKLKCEFLSYHFETYSVKARPGGTLIANFGSVRPLMNPELAVAAGIESQGDQSGAYLVLDDPLFDVVASGEKFLSGSLEKTVKKAGLKLDDVKTLITPHIGYLENIWKEDIVKSGLNADIMKNLRKKYGNTAVADILIDLAEYAEDKELNKDAIVVLWSVCQGVQLAAMALRWLV